MRLLFLVLHVYTTADLASHRGFGVVPVRGKDRPLHYRPDPYERKCEGGRGGVGHQPGARSRRRFTAECDRREGRAGAGDEGRKGVGQGHGGVVGAGASKRQPQKDIDGPLQCLTFEVLQCTNLLDVELMIAEALGVSSPSDIRLWVITQPFTDCPLAPRELLVR